MDNGFFNLNEFKKWMDDQKPERKRSKFIGIYVESKLSAKRLINRVESESDNLEEIMEDFTASGGTIIDVEGNWFKVQVNSGEFTVPRIYVKKG